MTLSNFDWTDKDSVRWFILLPSGHEGPYSFHFLVELKEKKNLADDVKIWAEGLSDPVLLTRALAPVEEVPDLPPLPILPDDVPPLPVLEFQPEEEPTLEKLPTKIVFPKWVMVSVAVLIVLFFGLIGLGRSKETFNVRRLPKMSLQIHQRILSENSFGGWDKSIFFKEYLPQDHGQIWLVTSSFHTCTVDATFSSLKNKLLSMDNEKVSFHSKGQLSDHIVELSSFEFTNGNRIIPGMYEMDVKASDCKWDGILPKIMNTFSSPKEEYVARTKVVLFSKGPVEFNKTLDDLLKKKMEKELKLQNQNELFWQDLQQKLETLQAMTLQIEQHVLDFLEKNPTTFKKNLKPMVDDYTRKYGSFLTAFVVENENYFKTLADSSGISKKRDYELMVRLTSKRIGLESMKFIEEFQGLKKNPGPKELENITLRVKKSYSSIKNNISEKIIQVSEDRSL